MTETVESLLEELNELIEIYEIDFNTPILHDELTQEQLDSLNDLNDKGLVWTQHGTCENEQISNGFHIFGYCQLTGNKPSGCGCYQSYCYYVAKKPYDGNYESAYVERYLPCTVCNLDGESEGDPNCKGPEKPKGAHFDECETGYIQWYFD